VARRRSRPRRRTRKSKGGPELIAGVILFIAVLIVAKWIFGLVVANGPLLLGATVLLAVVLVGALVLRRRILEIRRQAWLADNSRLERVDRLTPESFECLVEALLRRDGFHKVRRVGGSGDGGVDVIGSAPKGGAYIVQCKQWASAVGSPAIRDLLGALHAYPGHRGVIVTTARFTAPARDCAAGTNLILIDRTLLAAWLTGSYALAPSTKLRKSPWWARLRARPVAPAPLECDPGFGETLGN
jgi:restriction system protein